jgi:hypothetical protein
MPESVILANDEAIGGYDIPLREGSDGVLSYKNRDMLALDGAGREERKNKYR